MAADDCLDAITAAAGRALADDDLDRILTEVQAGMRKRRASGADPAGVGRDLADQARLAGMIEKRNRAINVLRRQALDARVPVGKEADAVMAVLTGVEGKEFGAARSIDAQRHGLTAELLGPLVADLRKAGLLEVLTRRDKAFDRDVARELWRLEDPNAKGGTGNAHAASTAEILHKYQEAARAMQNDAGAWIGKLDHYITRQSHDMAKIRGDGTNAAFQAWASDILPRLDPRTFDHLENPEDVASFLRGTWDALASGVHDSAGGSDWLGGFTGPANMAKKLSQERKLHFKDADAWFDYNERYGQGAVVDSIIRGLEHAARNTAVMRTLGTNPEALFKAWVDSMIRKARDRGDFKMVDKLRHERNVEVLDTVTGKANAPGSVTMARISQTVRNVQSMAKLGGVVLSSLPDIAVNAATLRWSGVGLLEAYKESVFSVLRGRGSGEVREIADSLAVGIDGLLGQVTSRFHAEDGVPGHMSKLVETFHRLNGLSWWTDSLKTGVGLMLSHNLARNAAKEFGKLDSRLQISLQRYGIGEAEWNALRGGAQQAADGRHYLTHDAVRGLDAAVIDPLIADRATALRAAYAEREAAVKAADAREAEWVRGRIDKYRAALDGERDKLVKAEARRTEKTAAEVERLRARVDRLAAQVEAAEAHADLSGAMRGLDTQQAMRKLLDEVERGRFAADVAVKTDRTVERAARRDMAAGEALGRRVKAAELRIKDAEARARETEAGAAQATETAHAAHEAKFKDLGDELQAFIEKMQERATERARGLSAQGDRLDPQIEKLRERKRAELETTLRTYLIDQTREAMTEPTARERNAAVFGTRPGTLKGEAVRTLMQFKSYPLTYARRTLGRELRRDGVDVAGVAHLIVATTALGYLSMTAKELVKGRSPRQPETPADYAKLVSAAMLQGGGLGIYGDFLFGENNRLSGGLISTLAGPTLGSIEHIHKLLLSIRDGEDPRAKALQVVKDNTPFINLFYTRAALDYLVFYRLQELMNPGYLRRMEQRVKKDNAQTFWLRPSEASR